MTRLMSTVYVDDGCFARSAINLLQNKFGSTHLSSTTIVLAPIQLEWIHICCSLINYLLAMILQNKVLKILCVFYKQYF